MSAAAQHQEQHSKQHLDIDRWQSGKQSRASNRLSCQQLYNNVQ
jgi:hypothetical protein